MISTPPSDVRRDVYGGRVAEEAKISMDAMQLEISRAYKRRTQREKKQQEKQSLAPARNHQPHSRSIRDDNMKSAMAEEQVIGQILREPALLDQIRELKPEQFSVSLFGKVYEQLTRRFREGMEVSLGGLTDVTSEEMSHLAGILHSQSGPISEQALKDCVRTIQSEYESGQVASENDLLAVQKRLKERKGMKA